MQVTLGRKGDYTVRAVMDLARHHGQGRRKAREIAAEMDIPERYLPQILANLVRQGLLIAVAGPDGGYALVRDPAEITLLEVVEMAEGPVALESCVLRGGPCDWEHACPLHVHWKRAQEALTTELSATSFRDLAEVDAALERGTYTERSDHAKATPRAGIRGGSTPRATDSTSSRPPPRPRRRRVEE
ncbi:MAG: Rrf2 family transcriptional regulator [Dehalococcoidia bacterium]|nr:Rrf2 family transcriptional regulator [Dehalococcoidia bacterium]